MARDLVDVVAAMYGEAMMAANRAVRDATLTPASTDIYSIGDAFLNSPELDTLKRIEAEAGEAGVLAEALAYRRLLEAQ